MALNAVILDLDGTLIDTNGVHARAWEKAFEQFGFRVPAERILFEIGKGGDRLVPALVGDQVEDRHGKDLREVHGDLFRSMIQEEEVPVFPKVPALIEALKERGLRVAVATASTREDLGKVLERAGLDLYEMTDAVVTDSDAERSKPAPDTVTAAVEKLNFSPGQCVMVGDTPYDAIACRRAGVVCLGVLTGVHDAAAMHRAGTRASYGDPAALLGRLGEALHRGAPGTAPLTDAHVEALMQEALDEAWAGLSEGERPIGSIVARGGGKIVGRGHNRARATGSRVAHAEMMALADAAEEMNGAEAAVLVSTLEPCVMCLGGAMEAGIDTVVYALPAPTNGGSERCTPPEEGFLPRLLGGVRAGGSRTLLQRWLRRYPEDHFVEGVLA